MIYEEHAFPGPGGQVGSPCTGDAQTTVCFPSLVFRQRIGMRPYVDLAGAESDRYIANVSGGISALRDYHGHGDIVSYNGLFQLQFER